MISPDKAGGRPRTLTDATPHSDTVWRSLECITGAAVAVGISLLSYSVLFDLTEAMGLLSSTTVTFIVIFVWIFAWGLIAATRDHVTGNSG